MTSWRVFQFARWGGRVRQAGWDEEAESGWEWDAGGVSVGEGHQHGGAGFARKKVRGRCVDGCEELAGDIERGGEKDGVEDVGAVVLAGGRGEDGPLRSIIGGYVYIRPSAINYQRLACE